MYLDPLANGIAPARLLTAFLSVMIVGALAAHFVPASLVERIARRLAGLDALGLGLVLGLAIVLINALAPEGVVPFIYSQF